jgi:hypothetical protein
MDFDKWLYRLLAFLCTVKVFFETIDKIYNSSNTFEVVLLCIVSIAVLDLSVKILRSGIE